MIIASDVLVQYIKNQSSRKALAKRWGVTSRTVYNIQARKDVSSDMIETVLKSTGFDFESAFVVTDGDNGNGKRGK